LAENRTKAAAPAKKKSGLPPLAIVVIVLALIGAGGFWYLSRPPAAPQLPQLTDAAKTYVRSLALSNVKMQAHESYLKQQIVEITGELGNRGDRALKTVEINCVFYDPYGQVTLRKRVEIVTRKMNGLAPGETKAFRLAFDDIPESWNQALPQLVIASIIFA
jgi:flagellar basal body-associated protein FliL